MKQFGEMPDLILIPQNELHITEPRYMVLYCMPYKGSAWNLVKMGLTLISVENTFRYVMILFMYTTQGIYGHLVETSNKQQRISKVELKR